MTGIIINDKLKILLVADIAEVVAKYTMDLLDPFTVIQLFPDNNSSTRIGSNKESKSKILNSLILTLPSVAFF